VRGLIGKRNKAKEENKKKKCKENTKEGKCRKTIVKPSLEKSMRTNAPEGGYLKEVRSKGPVEVDNC